jgi:hypothetical protein
VFTGALLGLSTPRQCWRHLNLQCLVWQEPLPLGMMTPLQAWLRAPWSSRPHVHTIAIVGVSPYLPRSRLTGIRWRRLCTSLVASLRSQNRQRMLGSATRRRSKQVNVLTDLHASGYQAPPSVPMGFIASMPIATGLAIERPSCETSLESAVPTDATHPIGCRRTAADTHFPPSQVERVGAMRSYVPR